MFEVCEARKTYRQAGREIRAVDGVSLRAEPGDLVVVYGPSGSGKTTLLLLLGGMLPPDAGAVRCDGEDIYAWPPGRRNRYRREVVGFVFQRFFLLPYLSVYDNIRAPLALARCGKAETDEIVRALAGRLRIEERLSHRPAELSAGEQQRVALARALAGDKRLILADEPTGNLDPANVEIIAECLQEESRRGRAVVLVTHNLALLDLGTKMLRLEAGRAAEETRA